MNPTATQKQYANIIEAISDNNVKAARDLLLDEIYTATEGKGSWDCPHYATDRSIQEGIQLHPENDIKFTYKYEAKNGSYFVPIP